MKLKYCAENFIERILIKLNLIPMPLFDIQISLSYAYTIMLAVKFNLFEILKNENLTAEQIALKCQFNKEAVKKLLNTLVASDYLILKKQKYSLTKKTKKWVLKKSSSSLYKTILFGFTELECIMKFDEYIKNGKTLDVHLSNDNYNWELYQESMFEISRLAKDEITKYINLSEKAEKMLDIGGSHGSFSAGLCEKNKNLKSDILELSQSLPYAKKIFDREYSNEKINYIEGNALNFNFQSDTYDIILMSQLMHHFSETENINLINNIYKSLKNDGQLIIIENTKPKDSSKPKLFSSHFDLFFGATSKSGLWELSTLIEWQNKAGFQTKIPYFLKTMPGTVIISGRKN